jgi:hypothetical protein
MLSGANALTALETAMPRPTLSRFEVTRPLSTRSRQNSSESSLNSVTRSSWVCEFPHRIMQSESVGEVLHCRISSESLAPREFLVIHDRITLTSNSIQFPGSRQYNSTPDIENAEELGEVPANELIKVAGTREQCQKAIEVLSQTLSTPPSRSQTPTGRGNGSLPTRTVPVPAKFYHSLVDGQIQRQLRQNGVYVDLPAAPAKPEVKRPEASIRQAGAEAARIDVDADDEGAEEINYSFEVYDKYEGLGEEGDAPLDFVIRGKEEVLEKGEKSKQRRSA